MIYIWASNCDNLASKMDKFGYYLTAIQFLCLSVADDVTKCKGKV